MFSFFLSSSFLPSSLPFFLPTVRLSISPSLPSSIPLIFFLSSSFPPLFFPSYHIANPPHSEFSSRSVTSLPLAISHPPWRQSLSPLHSGCQIANRTEQHMFEVMRGLEGQVGWFVRAVQVSFILMITDY